MNHCTVCISGITFEFICPNAISLIVCGSVFKYYCYLFFLAFFVLFFYAFTANFEQHDHNTLQM